MAVGSVATRSRAPRRSWTQSAIGSWVTTTDHKKIGIMYIYTAFFFFLVGGVLALLVAASVIGIRLMPTKLLAFAVSSFDICRRCVARGSSVR